MILQETFYQSLGEQFHLLLPYANPQEGQGTFFFPSDQLFQLDKVFYAGIGYLLAFGIFYSFGRFIGLFLNLVSSKKTRRKILPNRGGCPIYWSDLICPPDDLDHSCNGSTGSCSKFT